MKYFVLIMDGASGWPLENYGRKTCLELAKTPNLDSLAKEGFIGLVRTVPEGMEPSSACACMSILGYDPRVYFSGRGPIEAKSMGIQLAEDEVAFRCNLVAVREGKMWSYSSGHISDDEARVLIRALQERLGNERVRFHPGVSYRHICTIRKGEDCLKAVCTPPHDIPDKPIAEFMPHGPGSELLVDLMERSQTILKGHPINLAREARGEIPANMIWLFWGGKNAPELPPFQLEFGLKAALTSGVDLLKGLAKLAGISVLEIPGVTDNLKNDYKAQARGALQALEEKDIVFVHIEAPDEAAHEGNVEQKIAAIEQIDKLVVSQFLSWEKDDLRALILPDHPTPIKIRTHAPDPVPFLLWGPGVVSNNAWDFSENSAQNAGFYLSKGHELLRLLLK